MRPVSAAFLDAVRGSHTMRSVARVITTYQTTSNPTGATLSDGTTDLPIRSGQVRFDSSADVRGILDLTTTEQWGYPFEPSGVEIWVARGVVHSSASVELVSQGFFRITKCWQDNMPDGPIRIEASDRMSGIIKARLVVPRQFSAGTTVGSVVSTLATEVYPSIVIEYDDATNLETLPRSVVVERERYEFLKEMLRGYGKVMYFDYRGALKIESPPLLGEGYDLELSTGENGVMVAPARSLSSEGRYNGVVVTGEGADTLTPVRAMAFDNDPASPTYWSGPFLPTPRFFHSSYISTVTQAEDVARSELSKELGLPSSVTFGAVPNPAIEVSDRAKITTSEGFQYHIIDTLALGLTVGDGMRGTTRIAQSEIIGVSS